MNSLCKKFKEISKETWERIGFARNRAGLKIYETTITQNILFELHKTFTNSEIIILEALDENTNGNDIELFIKVNRGFLFFPTQAKIIYKSENYPAMEHGEQIKDLIKYASTNQGYPLYLLYNYISRINSHITSQVDHGCSIVSAKYLFRNYAYNRVDRNGNKKWIIPTFIDLHPHRASPWYVLACCCARNDDYLSYLSKIIPTFNDEEIDGLKIYSEDEVLNSNLWSYMTIGEERTENIPLENRNRYTEESYLNFNPKFRIVLTGRYRAD